MGRDYPTMGKVLRMPMFLHIVDSPIYGDYEVQWEIKADFESRILDHDLLLLNYDDINLVINHDGVARAVGDRVVLAPLNPIGLLRQPSALTLRSRDEALPMAMGQVALFGNDVHDIAIDDQIIYSAAFASHIRLARRDYFVVRSEYCIAKVEDR